MKAATAAAAGAVPGTVSLTVSSSLNAFRAHKHYGTGLTIAEFKCKLELVVGSPASCMDLELYSAEEEPLGRLDCDEALLGSYPVADGCRVHVTDRSGARMGEYEDVSQVEKYVMSESDYDKRTESLRTFLRQQRQQRQDADATRRWEAEEEQQRRAREAAALPVGTRCRVRVQGQPAKPATVMYLGETHFKPGCWVGVCYDEPVGKHDGSVGGCRYFQCPPMRGAFVRPQCVSPGDGAGGGCGLEEEL
ncbi:tubulin-folding cofactor B [Rhynochetos jubatus]